MTTNESTTNLSITLCENALAIRNAAIAARRAARIEAGYFITQESPYDNGFTADQLNMRRKIEVLQYRSASHPGTMMPIMSRARYPSTAARRYERSVEVCPTPIIAVPSYSTNADVPGTMLLFTYDDSVPLYNYIGTAAETAARATTGASAPVTL